MSRGGTGVPEGVESTLSPYNWAYSLEASSLDIAPLFSLCNTSEASPRYLHLDDPAPWLP